MSMQSSEPPVTIEALAALIAPPAQPEPELPTAADPPLVRLRKRKECYARHNAAMRALYELDQAVPPPNVPSRVCEQCGGRRYAHEERCAMCRVQARVRARQDADGWREMMRARFAALRRARLGEP